MVASLTQTSDRQKAIDDTRQQAAALNPIHANVSPQPIKTPREVQAGLAALVARYLARAYTKSITDSAAPEFFRKYTGANWFRDRVFANQHIENINARLQQFTPHIPHVFGVDPVTLDEADIMRRLRGKSEGETLLKDIHKLMNHWDGGELAHNTIQYFFKKPHLGGISFDSRSRIKSKMSEALFETYYDTLFGIGSILYTRSMQSGVRRDIQNIYAEAVGFEASKDPKDIALQDIRDSSNEIIQSTMKNYDRKRLIRYGITAIPFLRWVPQVRAIHWGEAAIGGWGLLWAADVWGREPTMLENFRSFVNSKLNPLYGIGEPIKSSDIIDLYQQYSYRFHPDIAFRSISVNDEDANLMWAKSERIFGRIASLMNESYNFKHTTELDPNTNLPKVKADFTLPKFIYLMGNGLLNARRPEWSMAFIELANQSPDMSAVKEAAKAMRQNASLADIVQKYNIDMPTEGFTHESKTEAAPKELPQTHIHSSSVQAAPKHHAESANLNHAPATAAHGRAIA